jgi:predicted AlkP superfamily pyrophosphatase or phosphodiesterase
MMTPRTAALVVALGWPFGLATSALAGGQAEPGGAAGKDRCVVLVSLDGCAQFSLDDPKSDLPTLRRMAREGAVADGGLTCSFPTVTWPNHTTLVTGVSPGRHGVLGNSVLDREKGEVVSLLLDPVFDKDQIVKVPTIYDAAHAAGLKTAGVVWPATRRAKGLDRVLPDMSGDHFEAFSTPAWLDELRAQGLPIDRYGPWVKAKEGGPRRDWMFTRAAIDAITRQRANLVLLHLIELDHAQHDGGPGSGDARWALSTMDDRLRDLRDAIEQAGLGDRTTVLVTSDHGFFATDHAIQPNVRLRELGLIRLEGKTVAARQAWSLSQGGAAGVYILDRPGREAIARRIARAMTGVEGIEAVFTPDQYDRIGQARPDDDPHAPDLWLAAKEGYSFSNEAAGDSVVTASKPAGTHGFLPDHPGMRGIFIAWGAGIEPGTKLGRVANTQVAPTIAKLLGLDFPSAEGKPVSAALSRAGR